MSRVIPPNTHVLYKGIEYRDGEGCYMVMPPLKDSFDLSEVVGGANSGNSIIEIGEVAIQFLTFPKHFEDAVHNAIIRNALDGYKVVSDETLEPLALRADVETIQNRQEIQLYTEE